MRGVGAPYARGRAGDGAAAPDELTACELSQLLLFDLA